MLDAIKKQLTAHRYATRILMLCKDNLTATLVAEAEFKAVPQHGEFIVVQGVGYVVDEVVHFPEADETHLYVKYPIADHHIARQYRQSK